jgi:hypothetical protein
VRSRVNSYDVFGSLLLRPAGFAVVGPVAAVVGLRPTLVASAVVMVALALVPLGLHDVRTLQTEDPPLGEGSYAGAAFRRG